MSSIIRLMALVSSPASYREYRWRKCRLPHVSQGMLDVFADRCIDVSPCGLIIPEGGVLGVDIFIVKSKLTGPQRPAIADIFINAVDPQRRLVPVWDEGGVDGFARS